MNEFLKLSITDFSSSGKVSVQQPPREPDRLLNHFIIELLASLLLMYSCVYVPEDANDFMKQYVGSITICAVMLTIKDKAYFCPDGTPMATAVMAASGAYTDKNGQTDWADIGVRVCGQLVGWLVICFAVVVPNQQLFAFSVPAFVLQVDATKRVSLSTWFVVFNEFIATTIECIAISFMVMPLLNSYQAVDKVEGFKSKEESAQPPKNKDLWFACMSLALLHYILERLFRSTMNPFIFLMHRFAANSFDDGMLVVTVVVVQGVGLAVACVYCSFMLPSQKVFEFLRN